MEQEPVERRPEEPTRKAPLGIGEGIRNGLGVLNALREAVEDTIREAADRGDLSPDRAREAARQAVQRAGSAFDGLLDRVEGVPRSEFEILREEVAELRRRVAVLEGGATARLELLPPSEG